MFVSALLRRARQLAKSADAPDCRSVFGVESVRFGRGLRAPRLVTLTTSFMTSDGTWSPPSAGKVRWKFSDNMIQITISQSEESQRQEHAPGCSYAVLIGGANGSASRGQLFVVLATTALG
jgi:hypothetical protein